MPKYAVIENDKVLNTIEAESIEIAESVTGFTCIEYTDEPAEPNGTYVNNRFIKAQPYPSWTLDENFEWQPPVPNPALSNNNSGKLYSWDEESLSWIEL